MATTDAPRPAVTHAGWVLLLALSTIPLVVHLATSLTQGYGYFIDEFYYIACAKRPAFGYVDHPPLAPWILALTRPVLGDSTLGIRLLPFLACSATVWLGGRLVQRLGGGRFATVLAALAIGLSPVMLAMTGFFSTNAFEPLLWTLTVLTLVTLVQSGNSKLWLVVGLLIGLGFENKHTFVAYVLALGVGVLATKTRRVLRDPWLFAGAAVALALAVPNLVWQAWNGWPSLEFYHNAQVLKNLPSPPLVSLLGQVLSMNPVAVPIWLAGLLYLLIARDAKPLRFLGVMFVVLLALHVASQTSRPDRMLAAYPLLLAAGAVVIERWAKWSPVRVAIPAALAASALFLAPFVVPVLPPAALARYVAASGLEMRAERGKTSPIPQLLADRTGWESFVDDVVRVQASLPAGDQKRALVYAPSYGQAGAVELLGAVRGLPRVIASQNTYWHWSVGRANTDVLIAVDANPDVLRQLFRDVWQAGRVRCEYCMSWRNDVPIFVGRGARVPLESVWARFKHYE